MKAALLLSVLLSIAFCSTTSSLDSSHPIYLGEVFWPPSMYFIAWQPSPSSFDEHLTQWCRYATDASNHALFSLDGIDALQIQDYFSEQAYITREGKRWADCYITPESMRMGVCEGVLDWNCVGGQKFTGPGTRRWSCWPLERADNKIGAREKEMVGAKTTAKDATMISVHSTDMMGAFTPDVTGH